MKLLIIKFFLLFCYLLLVRLTSLLSNTLYVFFLFMKETKLHTLIKQQLKLWLFSYLH